MQDRIEKAPFLMQNKMSFEDKSSPYYYRPIMLCSDVEAAKKVAPDIKDTEKWMQIVMHEYFHAFQFNHKSTINYLADSIEVRSDSLDFFYLNHKWFSESIDKENEYLLKAINSTSIDSLHYFVSEFTKKRTKRRQEFQLMFPFDISQSEKFWEKIEGSARYVEYNMEYIYSDENLEFVNMTCDTLFNKFNDYVNHNFIDSPASYANTKIIPAYYYYMTGFNLCRVLDKLKVNYQDKLFDNTAKGLEDYLR